MYLIIILKASKMQKYNFINKIILIVFYNAKTLSLYNIINIPSNLSERLAEYKSVGGYKYYANIKE